MLRQTPYITFLIDKIKTQLFQTLQKTHSIPFKELFLKDKIHVYTRAVVDGLYSPNWSLCRKVKAIGKWLVTGEEAG